jgi:hypothetical protein
MTHSKTKTSFYRRLYVAYLIDAGINSVPALMAATGMPRRTAQDTIAALHELNIACDFEGATKDGRYMIKDWGAINKQWIFDNLQQVKAVLEYP